MPNGTLDNAPRQFAVVTRPEMSAEASVVAWGQQFATGTVTVLEIPGTTVRQIFANQSAEEALALIDRLDLGPLALVWSGPTTEGV